MIIPADIDQFIQVKNIEFFGCCLYSVCDLYIKMIEKNSIIICIYYYIPLEIFNMVQLEGMYIGRFNSTYNVIDNVPLCRRINLRNIILPMKRWNIEYSNMFKIYLAGGSCRS